MKTILNPFFVFLISILSSNSCFAQANNKNDNTKVFEKNEKQSRNIIVSEEETIHSTSMSVSDEEMQKAMLLKEKHEIDTNKKMEAELKEATQNVEPKN